MPRGPDVSLLSLYPGRGQRHAGRSGVASYSANLARALADRGACVEVVAPLETGEPAESSDGNVRVRRAFSKGPRSWVEAAHAARRGGGLIAHLQFEAFLLGGALSVTGLPSALMRLRRARVPAIVTLHQVVHPSAIDGTFAHTHGVRAPAALVRSALAGLQESARRLAHRVIVHESSFGAAVPGATVIGHGVEAVACPERSEARSRLGLGDGPIVLCFGYVAPYKGLELALDATDRSRGAFTLVVAGGPHPRLGDGYAEQLRRRWPGVGRFTGFVSEEDIGDWFGAADLALFPYPAPFSSSGALALALAYGKPVLLSPAMADCIDAPRELVAPSDPDELSAKLQHTLAEPARLERLRKPSARLGRDRSWTAVAERHLDVYEEVLRAERAARGSLRPS